jgi:hypothetical protein
LAGIVEIALRVRKVAGAQHWVPSLKEERLFLTTRASKEPEVGVFVKATLEVLREQADDFGDDFGVESGLECW